MDEKKGLPSLPDKSIDLCLTDFPYGEDFDKNISPIKTKSIKKYKEFKNSKIKYNDKIIFSWLDAILKVSKGIIFSCGTKYHYNWIKYRTPDYHEKYWYKSNACSFIKAEPLLFYGKIKNYHKLRQVIEIPINIKTEIKTIHPTPKPFKLYSYILEKLKPDSVLDPFMGSGTTAQVCKKLGIPWIGYEINEIYKQDIEKRLNEINLKKSGLYHWL